MDNHKFKLYKLKTKTIYKLLYIIAVWESDMLQVSLKSINRFNIL